MKSTKLNLLGGLLCAVMLSFGLVLTSCEDGLLDNGEDTEQGENGNGVTDEGDKGSDNGGTGETNDVITNASGGVTLTVMLRNLTETGVAFYGEAVLAENYTAFSFGILYSEEETFTAATAQGIQIVDIYGTNYSVSTSSLKPSTTYYYTSYIKQGDLYKYGEIKSFNTANLVAPTLDDPTDITEVSATISGTVSLAAGTASDLEYGFQYSTSSDFSSDITSKKITDIDSENRFSLPISSLVPGTAYYCRSYIKMNGVYGYGEIKSFTAVDIVVPIIGDPDQITVDSVVFPTKLISPSVIDYIFEYGILFSTTQSLSIDASYKFTGFITAYNGDSGGPLNVPSQDVSADGSFTITLTGLLANTTYYYCPFACMNGRVVLGKIKSFTTTGIVPVLPSGYTNLSQNESANSYIVSQSGSFCLLVSKGNQKDNLLHSTESASLLWETFGTSVAPSVGDLIKSVSYKDGYITFQTADTFKEGNAVIAAKDASGTILWSWHIWLTDQPEGQVYYNNAGTMMDRNLGATSATPGDVGALGLLYQWGRKDPFLGSSSISGSTLAKSTIAWPSAVSSDSSNGTIAYATANPTTFIKDNSNFDWCYTGSSSTDNARWTTSSSTKSIYDPCPAGWRVPDGGSNGIWSKALGSSSDFTQSSLYDSTNEGINFSGKFGSDQTIWYPASGCRSSGDGGLSIVGDYGICWSASPLSDLAYGLYFASNGRVISSGGDSRAYGFSVRCLQVIDEVAGANAEESK